MTNFKRMNDIKEAFTGKAVCIPPLDITPEQLAKALLRPVRRVQEKSASSEKQEEYRYTGKRGLSCQFFDDLYLRPNHPSHERDNSRLK